MNRVSALARLVWAIGLLALPAAYGDSIPLKLDGGTYTVPVLINDKITLDFTIDSGSADVVIPIDVFLTLSRTGTIATEDLLRPVIHVLADGSELKSRRF